MIESISNKLVYFVYLIGIIFGIYFTFIILNQLYRIARTIIKGELIVRKP